LDTEPEGHPREGRPVNAREEASPPLAIVEHPHHRRLDRRLDRLRLSLRTALTAAASPAMKVTVPITTVFAVNIRPGCGLV
jgi:hypothetical protein